MDDTCAVCAESLEWVAYGSCGHKEVCSTCVARLRFICSDRRCCICKTESTVIYVTKALGDYTKMINDFSIFSPEDKEGRSGSYWYHEDTQAYFDDLDQYKMIKAMCRLSCSVCDKTEQNTGHSTKKRARFRDINQLKGHLFHLHRLFMCSLCLEGRKIFICEQKLYSKAQLKQHINTGDSEVDGTESERGGFQGHPICEFCRSPFYGDNELYTHMSTEHYTCHICQRQNPGQYEYYKNYDDLEIHFRQKHFLCEDEACLSKKFIVFSSEADMKRHNALEHGGRMSRAKRNAVLQLPTSFTYRRSNEQYNRRGRRHTFQRDLSETESSQAIALEASSSNSPLVSDHANINDIDPLIQPFEALGTDSDPPSRYLMAVSHRPRNSQLAESAFPPLSMGTGGSAQRPLHDPEGFPRNTMAEKLRKHNKKKVHVLNTAVAWPAAAPRLSNPVSRPASTSRISHSASAPNLVDTSSASDFPPVSTLQTRNTPPANGQSTNDVYVANKSMVEKIRAGLDYDEDRYAAFKDISAEYRQGVIDAETYLVYVEQFGLSHLALELARLCPDPRKERELIAVYNANRSLKGNGSNSKGKSVTNSVLSAVRELQANYRPAEEEVETLSKDGYRVANKGKSVDDGEGRSKQQRKKTSKFHRVRLGSGSTAAILDLTNSSTGSASGSDTMLEDANGSKDPSNEGLAVRGAWRNGGGHRLIVKDQRRG